MTGSATAAHGYVETSTFRLLAAAQERHLSAGANAALLQLVDENQSLATSRAEHLASIISPAVEPS